MGKKVTLNKKRLTKREVKELLATNPPLEVELSKPFEWTWANTGYVQKDSFYKLPDDTYLFVFDENSIVEAGRGDIYPKDYVHKWVKQRIRAEKDNSAGLSSSFQYWKHFSKNGIELINKSAELKKEIAERLFIPIDKLNYSYESLDLISNSIQKLEIEFIRENYMDNLVSYIGEVLIKRVNGHWDVTENNMFFDKVPYVSVDVKNVSYNPTNVVFTCFLAVEDIDLRKETANEVRSQSSRLSYEKHMTQFKKD